MPETDAIALRGVPGSPYTRKMLAVLRYRRIPYRFLVGGLWSTNEDLPRPKVELLPTFYFKTSDGGLKAVVDSTPIIRILEAEITGRSIIPSDPVLAFIDYLLEDYGDEWLTKAMFHYRWSYNQDIEQAIKILPRWDHLTLSDDEITPISESIRDRQVGRLYVVGSNDTTAPVIEESYKRFLKLFDAHIQNFPFTLGKRPGASDFGMYGQLTQLAMFDPTPLQVTMDMTPRVYAWAQLMEDLSGLEPAQGDWVSRGEIPATLQALLAEVGNVYVPLLLANARAVNERAETVEIEIVGRPWIQKPYPYQAKCLQWIRQEYAQLNEYDRSVVDSILAGTGCEALF